jgi:hypothetical protein
MSRVPFSPGRARASHFTKSFVALALANTGTLGLPLNTTQQPGGKLVGNGSSPAMSAPTELVAELRGPMNLRTNGACSPRAM